MSNTVINTNILSINAQRNLSKSAGMFAQSLERLSSGLRINSAKDDAAGLAIATRFSAQINGSMQAMRNTNDGISIAQTAEGSMNTIMDNLQKIRVLAVQSASDGNSTTDREAIQRDVSALLSEVSRIASTTEFNGQRLLDGTTFGRVFQIGANQGQTIQLDGVDVRSNQIGTSRIESTAGLSQKQVTAGFEVSGNLTLNLTQSNGVTLENALKLEIDLGTLTREYQASYVGFNDGLKLGQSSTLVVDLGGMAAIGDIDGLDLTVNGTRLDNTAIDWANDVTNAQTLVMEFNSAYGALGLSADYDTATDELTIKTDPGVTLEVGAGGAFLNGASGANQVGNDIDIVTPLGDDGFRITGLTDAAAASINYIDLKIDGTAIDSNTINWGAINSGSDLAAALNGLGLNLQATYDADNDELTLYNTMTGQDLTSGGVVFDAGTQEGTAGTVEVGAEVNVATTNINSLNDLTRVINSAIEKAVSGIEPSGVAGLVRADGTAATESERMQWGLANIKASVITLEDGTSSITLTGSMNASFNLDVEDFTASVNNATQDQVNFFGASGTGVATSAQVNLDKISVATRSEASLAISVIDGALAMVSESRSQIGSTMLKFESNLENLGVARQNMEAAKSRILDTDFASETANMTKAQILQQAGISVLAQANASSQSVLSLLQ